ncbi:MAG: transposase [Actinomycetota bacterium]|jgi:Transposase DDE domain|nr:transposase [Actinomycetota bacterium]
MSFTKLDYCQYLLSSQVNYTLTNLAEHLKSFSHDTINRYLKGEKLTPRLLFEQVEPMLEQDSKAYLIFDDTVLEKSFGPSIEVTRKQWSGNEKSVIRGIGVVSCVYVDPKTGRFWVIDYRIFDPDADGKTKLDHVREMLGSVEHRGVTFETVLIDAWYATKEMMLLIERMAKKYYCPLKSNRQVDDSGGQCPYQRVDGLDWSEEELEKGKTIKIKGFPRDHKVKLFRVVVHSRRTEWIVTNGLLSRDSVHEAQKARLLRWKIEEFHREAKQLTGIERCQCRSSRIQRNHIACALLVWSRLKHLAYQSGRTVYQIKHGLLHDYLVQQLKNPSVQMVLA